jgi:fructokinase
VADANLYGGIEAGGTKFVCVVGTGPAHIVDETRIETSQHGATLEHVIQFFKPYRTQGRLSAIGIGSFGPLDLVRDSPTYGFITSTPKPGWQNTDLVGPLRSALDVHVELDTDVTAAALGEWTWGATAGIGSSLYMTIGTGIGAAYLHGPNPIHGFHHSEMGHIGIPHDVARDPFPGSCPFHGACFEGLASGTAIRQRLGKAAEELRDDDPFWDLEAGYVASALASIILVLSPSRIVLGGGIMHREFLFPQIRRRVLDSLGNYLPHNSALDEIEQYIVPPALGPYSGSYGAIALAMRSAQVGELGSQPHLDALSRAGS